MSTEQTKEQVKEQVKEENIDYSKYTFPPNATLEVSAAVLNVFRQFAQEVLEEEGVGIFRATKPRHMYVHNETGEQAKENTSKKKLDANYTRTYDHASTMQAGPEEFLLTFGKKALSIIEFLNSVHKSNIDEGRGMLKEDFEKMVQEERAKQAEAQKAAQDQAVQEETVGPKLVLDPQPGE